MIDNQEKRFNLRRYYSWISFVFILVIAIALGWISRHFAMEELLSLSQQKNIALTTIFKNALWPEFAPLLARASTMSAAALQATPEIPLLKQHVLSLMRDTDVVKIKIYNLDGITVFSTDSKQIGEDKKANQGVMLAANGHAASELTHRDTFDAFEGVIEDRDLASTYLPVRNQKNQVEAVFELYSDVTPFLQQLQRSQAVIVLSVIGLLGALYGALYFIVLHAHRIIQLQRTSLEKSNQLLDGRVRERTRELVHANELQKVEIIERRRAEEAGKRLVIEKDAILNNISEGVAFLKHGVVLTCNPRMEELFGFGMGDFIGKRIEALCLGRDDYLSLLNRASAVLKKGLPFQAETELVRKDGSVFWANLTGRALLAKGRDGASVWVIADISERKKAEERLRLTAKVFENTQEGVVITDRASHILAVNQAFTQVTGYQEEEVIGRTPGILQSGCHDQAFYDRMWHELDNTGQWKGEIANRRKNGEIYPQWLSISGVRNENNELTHYVGVFSDITEIKQSQEKVKFLAYNDHLTQLPNRLLFTDRLNQRIQRVGKEAVQFAVYFIDLDHFKDVNDSLGHHIGDLLLQEVARQMQAQLRQTDTIARLGGDEFIILVEDIDGAREAACVAEKIACMFEQPFSIGQHSLYITASIGICLYPMDGNDINTLLRNADAAMYRAKSYGRNRFHFYEEEMTAYALERLELESALRKAIINSELVLFYQPQINLETNQIVGAEALVRWNHPQLGLISPAKFIPIAEETGLIIPLGEWVLNTACKQMQNWKKAGIVLPKIAVNLSVKQLERKDFAKLVETLLIDCELDPACLELEITESVLMHAQQAFELITTIEALGVYLSVDDFGTGYSSLSYLKRLPVHKLKIDRSFITDIIGHGGNQAIVRAIIGMAKTLGLRTVAEGVENAEQAAFLLSEGCDHAQGYLFSRPIPANDFAAVWPNVDVAELDDNVLMTAQN